MIASLLADFDRIRAKIDESTKAQRYTEVDRLLRSNSRFFMDIIEAMRGKTHLKGEGKPIDIVEKLAEGVKVTVEEEATGLPCRECGKKGWHSCEGQPQPDCYTKAEIDQRMSAIIEFQEWLDKGFSQNGFYDRIRQLRERFLK